SRRPRTTTTLCPCRTSSVTGNWRPSRSRWGSRAMPNLDPIVRAIRAEHRKRNFAMESRKRSDLALGAYLRLQLDWRKPPSEEEIARDGLSKAGINGIMALTHLAGYNASFM